MNELGNGSGSESEKTELKECNVTLRIELRDS